MALKLFMQPLEPPVSQLLERSQLIISALCFVSFLLLSYHHHHYPVVLIFTLIIFSDNCSHFIVLQHLLMHYSVFLSFSNRPTKQSIKGTFTMPAQAPDVLSSQLCCPSPSVPASTLEQQWLLLHTFPRTTTCSPALAPILLLTVNVDLL